MADAISAVVGMALMIAFLAAMVLKLNELPLWIVALGGILLMIVAFWQDAFAPLIRRGSRNGS